MRGSLHGAEQLSAGIRGMRVRGLDALRASQKFDRIDFERISEPS